MITQQQFEDAVADFEGLIRDNRNAKEAVSEAANSNGIDPAIFESRLTRDVTLDDRAAEIRRKQKVEAIRFEVESAASKKHPASVFDDCFDPGVVATNVEERIGRPIGDDDVAQIEDVYRASLRSRVQKFLNQYKRSRSSASH